MYDPIGYYEVNYEDSMILAALELRKQAGQGQLGEWIHSQLMDYIDERKIKLESQFTEQSLSAVARMAKNTEIDFMVDLVHLLAHVLRAGGYVAGYFPRIAYRHDGLITLDELATRTIRGRFPEVGIPKAGGTVRLTWGALPSYVAMWAARLEVLLDDIDYARKVIEAYINDIHYRVSRADGQITAFEQCLHSLAMTSPTMGGAVVKVRAHKLDNATYGPLISRLPGLVPHHSPFALAPLIASGSLAGTIAFRGPLVGEYKLAAGQTGRKLGVMSQLFLEVIDSWKVTADDQLAGLSESAMAYTAQSVLDQMPGIASPERLLQVPLALRETGPDPVKAPALSLLATNEIASKQTRGGSGDDPKLRYVFDSYLLGRPVLTDDFGIALADAALRSKRIGDTALASSSIDGFGICDARALLSSWTTKLFTPKPLTDRISNLDTKVTFVINRGMGSTNEKKEVDLKYAFTWFKEKRVVPALSEYVFAPMRWLSTPQPEIVDYVSRELDLGTETGRQVSAEAITAVANEWRVRNILGAQVRLPFKNGAGKRMTILEYAETLILK